MPTDEKKEIWFWAEYTNPKTNKTEKVSRSIGEVHLDDFMKTDSPVCYVFTEEGHGFYAKRELLRWLTIQVRGT